MSIATTSAVTDLLERGWEVERERRREIAESLAALIYPWPALDFEVRAQEVVGGFPPTTSKGEIASFWMQMQLLGDAVAEKSGALFPGMDWELDGAETCALFSATPFTTDEIMLGRIVAFAEASRRLVVPDDSLEDRARFRAVLIELAKQSRIDLIESADRARRKRSGLRVVNIAPGWFRIEYPRNVAEIRRALRDEDRRLEPKRRKAARP
jgi:hypothetical protein